MSHYPTTISRKRRYTVDTPSDPGYAPAVYATSTEIGRVTVGRPDAYSNDYFTADAATRIDGKDFRAFAPTRNEAVNEVVNAVRVWKWLREDLTVDEANGWLEAA